MNVELRPATIEDVDSIQWVVDGAYDQYVSRLGVKPGPMLDNYRELVETERVFVACLETLVIGVLVLKLFDDRILLDNVAVHPDYHARGVGRILLKMGEQQAQVHGFTEIHLYTHELMTENIEMYKKIGYRETHRVTEAGYNRVYMSKEV